MKSLFEEIYKKWNVSGYPLYFFQAPQGQAFPYALYFMITESPDFTFTSETNNFNIQFSIFSNENSANEILEISDQVNAIYADCRLDVQDWQFIKMERTSRQLIKEDKHWHMIIEYDVILHK